MEIAKAGWLQRQSAVLRRWKRQWVVLYRDGWLRYFDSQDDPKAEEAFLVSRDCTAIKLGDQCVKCTLPDQRTQVCLVELNFRPGGGTLFCADSLDDASAWYFALEEAKGAAVPQAAPAPTFIPPPAQYRVPAPQHQQHYQRQQQYQGQQQYQQQKGQGQPQYHQQQYQQPQYQQGAQQYPPQQQYVQQPAQHTTIVTTNSPYPRQNVQYAYPGQFWHSQQPGQTMVQMNPNAPTTIVVDDGRRRRDDEFANGMMAGAMMGAFMWGPCWYW